MVELGSPGYLNGDEDEPGSGTVRIGGDGCEDCLFFKKPSSKEWINIGRPNGKTLERTRSRYSFKAEGFVLTNSAVRIAISPDDPGYGALEVTWP